MRICLTGGIACGKSLLSAFLRELGVEIVDADDIVHELLPDADERRRLAAEVFTDPVKRRALEQRLHPIVWARINRALAAAGERLAIAVVPLLFEVQWQTDYDIICAVVSSRELQLERMISHRGYTREEAEARLAAQLPVETKAEKSHYVIWNNASAEELRQKAQDLVAWLKSQV